MFHDTVGGISVLNDGVADFNFAYSSVSMMGPTQSLALESDLRFRSV